MSRIWKAFLLTLLLSSFICLGSSAYADNTASGSFGDNLTWSFNESNGTLIISGSGAMPAYGQPWSNYGQLIQKAVLSDGVTSISQYAFNNCSSLNAVSIPSTVKTIGGYAFMNSGLSAVVIPDSVKTIGEYAFKNCTSLSEITLPGNISFNNTYQLTYGCPIKTVHITCGSGETAGTVSWRMNSFLGSCSYQGLCYRYLLF